MTGKELRNLRESYFEMYNPERVDEAFKSFPSDKVQRQATRHELVRGVNKPQSERKARTMVGTYAGSNTKEWADDKKSKERTNRERPENEKRSKTVEPNKPKQKKFPNRLMRGDRQGIRDSYDYYDIILSHLLDEGYAETPEAAEAIMVNMSEEWRQSILG